MRYGVLAPGYRLPETTRIGAVRLQVTNLDRSLAYYQGILGLALLRRDGADASLGAAGGARPLLHLHERDNGPAPGRGERLGLYHFALLVPERAALGRLTAHLAASGVKVAAADHAVSEALYLWDPDGLGIEVYADRPREQWQTKGPEIFMTTERLDMRGLMTAAGQEPWTVLPAGTVLGHMHLHVGDLAGAEAFYHRALGFDKTVWSYPGALFLSAGGYHHHLGTNTWAANAPRRAENEPGLLEWEILVPTSIDAEAAADSCDRAGADVERQGDTWIVRDPWGTALRLVPPS